MTVKIKKLRENAIIPKRATEFSAGADLYACIDEPVTIEVSLSKCLSPIWLLFCLQEAVWA